MNIPISLQQQLDEAEQALEKALELIKVQKEIIALYEKRETIKIEELVKPKPKD